jgi:transposase-like protein
VPWKETTPMHQRTLFIADHLRGTRSVTELCAEYGIARKTAYKWIEGIGDIKRLIGRCRSLPGRTYSRRNGADKGVLGPVGAERTVGWAVVDVPRHGPGAGREIRRVPRATPAAGAARAGGRARWGGRRG